jgi:hypothetical protein
MMQRHMFGSAIKTRHQGLLAGRMCSLALPLLPTKMRLVRLQLELVGWVTQPHFPWILDYWILKRTLVSMLDQQTEYNIDE